ncbi:MAG: OmpA family protein, partial [Burkholderiales bacterium]
VKGESKMRSIKILFMLAAALLSGNALAYDKDYADYEDGYDLCWLAGLWWKPVWANPGDSCLTPAKPVPVAAAPAPTPKAEPKPEPKPAPAPKPAPVKAAPQKFSFEADALFDFNKADLRERGKNILGDFASNLQNTNYEVITVIGHADRLGAPQYNQKLSEKRAAAVKAFLMDQGIPPNKIYSAGKGSTQPVTTKAQCKNLKRKDLIACLQPDRRVDIEVAGTK